MSLRNETITRHFGPLIVDLYFFEEGGEQRSMGDVTLSMYAKDEATGSLDRLIQTGELTNWDTGEEVEVARWLVDAVHTWAEEQGY